MKEALNKYTRKTGVDQNVPDSSQANQNGYLPNGNTSLNINKPNDNHLY